MIQNTFDFEYFKEKDDKDDFVTIMPDDFVTIIPRKKPQPRKIEITPSILYNYIDNRIMINRFCVCSIDKEYAFFRQGISNKNIVMLKGTDTEKPGAHKLRTNKEKPNGTTWIYKEILEIFEACDTVKKADKTEHEKFRFWGEYDAKRNAVLFDLSKCEPEGKVKRRRRTSK